MGTPAKPGPIGPLPNAVGYAGRCILQTGAVARALETSRRAADIVERDIAYFAECFLDAGNIGPTLRTVLNLACKAQGNKVPIFQRIVLFPVADALHHAGRLDEAAALFEFGYQSRLPLAVSSWDLFAGHDGMFYDLLLTLGRVDDVRRYANARLKSAASPLLSALMHTMLLRAEVKELSNADRIAELETALLHHGEQLDYRTSYQYVRGLLELAASSRRCGEFEHAASIIGRARRLKEILNLGLLEVELLIEQAALALDLSDVHAALSRAAHAQALIEKNGYGLRAHAVQQLLNRVQELDEAHQDSLLAHSTT